MNLHYITFVLTSLLFTSASLNAQNWFSDNPKWTNYYGGFGIRGLEEVTVEGETFIDDRWYKIIQRKYREIDLDLSGNPINNDTSVFIRYDFAFEEDDRVYFYYDYLSEKGPYLSYDFNLGPGDTLILAGDICKPDMFIVRETGTTSIGGETLRYQKLFYYGSKKDSRMFVIEKIGFIGKGNKDLDIREPSFIWGALNMNEDFDCVFVDPSPRPHCFKNDLFEFKLDEGDCDRFGNVTSLSEVNTGTIRIFPNPFKSFIEIKPDALPGVVQQISITDLTGNVVFVSPVHSQQARYRIDDLSHLSKGVYLLSVSLEEGQKMTRKVVKF